VRVLALAAVEADEAVAVVVGVLLLPVTCVAWAVVLEVLHPTAADMAVGMVVVVAAVVSLFRSSLC
jgi:hypothetical protein